MKNELIEKENWWQKNWKWFAPSLTVIILAVGILLLTLTGGNLGNFAQAYSDTELYENALQKANSNLKVKEELGELEPISKLAIIEGDVQYSKNNQFVEMTVRVSGSKGRAAMDIAAERIQNSWNYKKIIVRIKNPPEKKQTINVIP